LRTSYRLAGYNLLYDCWEALGSPINQGWTVTREDLRRALNSDIRSDLAFLIDFDPSANWRIGIIEIDKIHAYTVGEPRSKTAYWSPLMIEFSTVFDDDEYENLGEKEKQRIIRSFEIAKSQINHSIEFLYVHGTERSWSWGRNGSTNAAFIGQEARIFFREFF